MSSRHAPQLAPHSVRQGWKISAAEVGPDGLLGPTALVTRAVAAAASLVGEQETLTAVSIEDLKIVSPVHAGAELVFTAALEREQAGQRVVSVVIRHGEPGAQGGIAAVGVLKFAVLTETWKPTLASRSLHSTARRGAALGLTPVEASFRVTAGPGALSNLDLIRRVQETSLVSAQGFARHPVAFDAIHGLSVLGQTHPGQALRLQCSVVFAEGGLVTVLSRISDEKTQHDVLCALVSFNSRGRVPALRPSTAAGREVSQDIARLHLKAAS